MANDHHQSMVREDDQDLRSANERLLITGLKHQQVAERARRDTENVTRQLERQKLLAEANALLDTALDVRATLRRLARMAVPTLADWSVVDFFGGESAAQVAVAHVDEAQEAKLLSLQGRLPLKHPATSPIGGPARPSDAELRSYVFGTERQQLLHGLGARAYVCVPLRARERLIGALTLVFSVSERRLDQDELNLAEELAKHAGLAIDNARLYQEAVAAVRLRDDVLAIVSHDLRNPLNSIALSAEAILHDKGPSGSMGRSRKAESIRRSVDHLKGLIDELIDQAGIQAGRLVLRRSNQNVIDVVEEAFAMLEPVAKKAGLELERNIDDGGTLSCDKQRLIRVFSNLVGNAIKFSPKGSRIVISAESVANEIRFAVRDTGCGIASTDLPMLFEAYWKGKDNDKKGSGLGLFISKRIVEAHGGRIWVETEPDAGAVFIFTIPLWMPATE